VEAGKLYGSWGSEPGRRGGSDAARQTLISPADGGYAINGAKHFCTMAGAAHRYLVHCSMSGHEDPDAVQLALVPSDTPGIAIRGEWDTLGMRATVSPSVEFEDCYVDQDCLLGTPDDALTCGVVEGFGIGYAAVHLGAARRALDVAVEYCKTHQFAPDPGPRSNDLVVQRGVAEMTTALDGARLVLHDSARRWEGADAVQRLVLGARAKYLATEASLTVTARCVQIVGGRSVHKGMPPERLYRGVRTATLMPPNADRSMEIVGRTELGVEG
jgi:hypothetical protein